MKRIVLGSLSVLLLSTAAAPAARSQTTAINSATSGSTPSYINQTTPFNLVFLAYRGYFQNQGIPSYTAFIWAHQAGKISAEDLVESAVKANRLSEEVLTNQGYLSAVEAQLNSLVNRR